MVSEFPNRNWTAAQSCLLADFLRPVSSNTAITFLDHNLALKTYILLLGYTLILVAQVAP